MKNRDLAFMYGEQFTASTALELAQIELNYTGKVSEIQIYKGETYSCFADGQSGLRVNKILNGTVFPAYDVKNQSYDSTNRYSFVVDVTPVWGETESVTLASNNLNSPGNLSAAFMGAARTLLEANQEEFLALRRYLFFGSKPLAERLDAVGYHPDSSWHIFTDFAITEKGELIEPTDGYFSFRSRRLYPKLGKNCVKPDKCDPKRILNLMMEAWGMNALMLMSWVVANWFIHLIKVRLKFFPFMSLYGDTQVGKSNLCRMANCCQGINEEGIPMVKQNTTKGEVRKLASGKSIMIAMVEGNDSESVKLLDTLLPAYNHGNPIQTRAVKTMDNTVNETLLEAGLLFVQNTEPFRSKAQIERIISLEFRQDQLPKDSKVAFDELNSINASTFGGFIVEVMKHREFIEEHWHARYNSSVSELNEILRNSRISENFALVDCFAGIVTEILGIEVEYRDFVLDLARRKMSEVDAVDYTEADVVFEVLGQVFEEKYSNPVPGGAELNPWLFNEDERLYVSVPRFFQQLKERNSGVVFSVNDLINLIKAHRSFRRTSVKKRVCLDGKETQVNFIELDMTKLPFS